MEELLNCCELHNESYSNCLVVLNYLTANGWSEDEAILHIIGLVTEGWFKEVRELVK